MDLFEAKTYLHVIKSKIEGNKGIRGYQTLLSKASGCQRSYLSQVLATRIHLTPDHAARMAKFWKLSDDETDYFLELLTLARAGSEQLREVSQRRLSNLRRKRQDLAERIRSSSRLPQEASALYYATWQPSAIHVLLAIPEFQNELALASRLGLSLSQVQNSLKLLEALQLVHQSGKTWKVSKHDLHLPKDSPFTALNHLNWRHRALHRIQLQDNDLIHFTGVFALSRRGIQTIKDLLIEAITRSRKVVLETPEEEMVCLTLDFFRV